ncbi:MAG: hypothetical protein Ct9H300mP28_16260 [Pseudomonadota bacterium]|nr:MAG: hypothetical protein Ct9H300mP28_16260 [Pseudomonadota bacterium]
MGNVLVITEHMKGEFQDISFEMLGQARKLADGGVAVHSFMDR